MGVQAAGRTRTGGTIWIWEVDRRQFDRIMELSVALESGDISQAAFIERMRSLGYPPQAKDGDEVVIRYVPRLYIGAKPS